MVNKYNYIHTCRAENISNWLAFSRRHLVGKWAGWARHQLCSRFGSVQLGLVWFTSVASQTMAFNWCHRATWLSLQPLQLDFYRLPSKCQLNICICICICTCVYRVPLSGTTLIACSQKLSPSCDLRSWELAFNLNSRNPKWQKCDARSFTHSRAQHFVCADCWK